MADGLRRAMLEALCSRGPWRTVGGEVTGDQVRELYDNIAVGTPAPWIRAGLGLGGDRTTGRALQMLRSAGLIRYRNGRWEVNDA